MHFIFYFVEFFLKLFCTKPYDNLKELIEEVMEKKVKKIISVNNDPEDFEMDNTILDVYVLFEDGEARLEFNLNIYPIDRRMLYADAMDMFCDAIKKDSKYLMKKHFYQINLSWGLPEDFSNKKMYELRDLKTGEICPYRQYPKIKVTI